MTKKILAAIFAVIICAVCCNAGGLQGSLGLDKSKIINPGIIGPGVNFSFSDYEYFNMVTGAEWTNIKSRHLPRPGNKQDWKDFNRLMDIAGFSYVRLCTGLTQWEPVNDNNDPFDTDCEGGFAFSPGFDRKHPELPEINRRNVRYYMDAMHILLDKWEKEDKYVVLGNWDEGKNNFCGPCGHWLRELAANKSDDRQALHADIPEMTESLAAIMYHLVKEKGYKCVKGISFYNEPEGFDNYYGTLAEVYGTLASQLDRLGIRDKVKIQAFDGSVLWNRENNGVPDGVARLLKKAGNAMDIVSFHDYWTRFDYMTQSTNGKTHGTIKDYDEDSMVPKVLKQIDDYNKTHGRDVFYVIGEMGSFEYTGGDTGTAVYQQRLHNAEYTARAFNSGIKAVAYWVYNTNYHKHWRFITFDENDRFVPDPVNFYPMALTMRYIRRNSDVAETKIEGCRDENGVQRVWACAALKNGNITLLLVNDGTEPAALKLPEECVGLRHLFVTESKSDNIYTAAQKCGAEITLEPESINVLTSYKD